MKLKLIGALCAGSCLFWQQHAVAVTVGIQLEVPAIETSQYHRPYVAVWVEDEQQQPVRLIALWTEKPDWLKDLRRFWRKIGRSDNQLVDAVSGATRKPGTYQLEWDGADNQGTALPAGSYTLYVEAAREQGGRSLLKHDFELPASGKVIQIAPDTELGAVTMTIR